MAFKLHPGAGRMRQRFFQIKAYHAPYIVGLTVRTRKSMGFERAGEYGGQRKGLRSFGPEGGASGSKWRRRMSAICLCCLPCALKLGRNRVE